ncbi:nicotinamidase/pyrazinamidase [Candidatus Hepatincolaceae symbiont of Richtersius coronifer]
MSHNQALIIIDLQNDFLEGGALGIKDSHKIIPIINNNISYASYSKIICTQDYHPQNHISFASAHNYQLGKVINVQGKTQALWPTHCVAGSLGAEISSNLLSAKIDKFIYKGQDTLYDSYSAFYDDKGNSTGLYEYLKQCAITEVVLVGLALDWCVKATAQDAVKLGYKVKVLLKATCSINFDPHNYVNILRNLIKIGVSIC